MPLDGRGVTGFPARGVGGRPARYCHSVIRIWLAHGASGTAASMTPWIDRLRALGVEAHALDLPRRKAEETVARFEAQVPDEPGVVIGGHSYGGRVASLAAAGVRAEGATLRQFAYAGLVCLSYPIHRPGAPDSAAARIAHWPQIAAPTLLLSGRSDPFARIDLLEAAMPLLARGSLVTYPRLGHTLRPVIDDATARVAAFLAALEPRTT